MIKKWFKNIGPGPLVAAAFIGPGTITVCTLAGVNFGFALLWAMALSIVATIVLQEMSARVGIVSQKGLSNIIRTEIKNPILKWFTILLILSAIVIGNAVYEAGNISGGILGLEALLGESYVSFGSFSFNYLSMLMGVIAFVLLFIGNYKVLEKALISLVIAMSLAFLITAIITKPDLIAILSGIFKPSLPKDGLLTVIALIGTTVVPYNLFLHASLVSEKWKSVTDLQYARKDTIVAVVLGGVVSMCVIISAAAIQGSDINSAADLAKGLEPLFGSFAKYFLAIGLFAAGITSAITAPLAAAYVTCGCLGWSTNLKSSKFRTVWMLILFLGVLFSSLGIKPIDIIKFAQIANGILLPIIAAFLLWIMNKKSVLGVYKNNIYQNILGFIILAISILLSVATLNKVFSLNLF
ncbi:MULTISPECIES: Nramp family divalent metal transporter [unclassified Cellulophaga]|uniref:Nramp family divalent metal transporter n=1 Tax=unclassified Cellulophaga TaxID=2634405 RepID=UPI0026E3E737|nr:MULTISPECIES: Nramp family divalent metal transporter [unclassified Cellulophaga]MDO6491051.1 Nramp family divalent metal transporter [Cellulophaga sp. 2_MG-2023]MDO6493755.1 Nramp family divalent metal transporter [Cellulophaga sp. 3_MG-2023]